MSISHLGMTAGFPGGGGAGGNTRGCSTGGVSPYEKECIPGVSSAFHTRKKMF